MASLTTTSSVAVAAAAAAATTTALPLTVVLRKSISDMSDFFPFDDLATLSQRRNHDSLGDVFSFRGLIEDGIDGGQDIFLIESGCLIDGSPDCSRACLDAAVFFGSLETFYNCAALASIAYWSRDSPAYYIGDEAERNASAVMGRGDLATFDPAPVLDTFISCAHDACENDGLAVRCHDSVLGLETASSSTKQVLDAIGTFCPAIEAEINPDIFGPGVRTRTPCLPLLLRSVR